MMLKTLKYIFSFSIITLIVVPSLLSVNAATTNTLTDTTRIVNLESFTGTGFCEEKGLYSLYTGKDTFNGTGTIQATVNTTLNLLHGCAQFYKDANGNIINYNMIGGAMSTLSSTTGVIYQSTPASLAWQVEDTIARISPVKQIEAQAGLPQETLTGVGLLSTIASFHKSVLNLVLSLYVIIFAVIAIGILFRSKLGGQEYVSLINSIPRIIVSLILVAFSLPISGLIIDAGNVGYAFVYNVFVNNFEIAKSEGGGTLSTNPATTTLLDQLKPSSKEVSVWQVFGFSGAGELLDPNSPNTTLKVVSPNIGGGIANGATQLLTSGITKIIEILSTTFNVLGGKGFTSDINSVIALILSIGAFFALFKTFFALLKEFIVMLFYPVFSPFFFALSAIPGQSKSVMNYIRTLLASVLSFVAVYAVFLMIIFLGKNFVIDRATTVNLAPPLIGFSAGGINVGILSSLAAYGLFVIAPGIPGMVKSALAVSEGGGAGKIFSQVGDFTKGSLKKIPVLGSLIPG